jgi:hypothetical protein
LKVASAQSVVNAIFAVLGKTALHSASHWRIVEGAIAQLRIGKIFMR